MIARPAMPNDLSIQAAALVNTGNDGVAPVRPAATTASAEQAAPAPTSSPNPTLALNAALGLVVIEFRNAAGAVVSSIPTQQQLAAYRLWQESGIGGPPPNVGAAGAATVVPARESSGGIRSTASSV